MNVVYKITFQSRIERNEPPYYYIGSKVNCTFDGTNIIDSRGNIYRGSSKYPGYTELLETEDIKVEIIKESLDNVLLDERDIQLQLDVVRDPDYFNLSIATTSTYNAHGYGSFKHKDTGKVVKLPVNDPMVLDGTYVGVTKGHKLSQDHIDKISANSKRTFLGKTHSDETIDLIRSKAIERQRNMSDEQRNDISLKMSKSRAGVAKSESFKNQLKDRQFGKQVTLQHPELGTITVYPDHPNMSDELDRLRSLGYMNPYALAVKEGRIEKVTCPHCNKSTTKSMFTRWHGDKCKSLQPKKADGRGKGRKGLVTMVLPSTLDKIDVPTSERSIWEGKGWITNAKHIRSKRI